MADRRCRFIACLAHLFALICVAPAIAQEQAAPLRVALTGKFPPFSFYDNSGQLTGFDVDVSRAIATHIGRDVEIITTEWDGILTGLLAGKYDVIVGSMAITPPRQEQVDFSEPYYISGAQLFVQKTRASEVKSIEDLKGQSVGVVLGETYEHYLLEHHPEINVRRYKSSVEIFQEMESGMLDGFVTDRLVGVWQTKSAGKPFAPAGELLYDERMGIPVVKSRPELLAQINDALREMKKSKELETLFDKWFGLGAQAAQDNAGGMSLRVVSTKLGKGFALTLAVAVASILAGFALAVPIGIILNRGPSIASMLVRGAVDFLRGTPVLIQLLFVYFGLPLVFSYGGGLLGYPDAQLHLSPIVSAIVTLSINAAAYMSEVIRSGLMSVDRGQVLAGRALGLSAIQIFGLVVWPQAFRIAMPPLMNSVVALIKDTALISIISVSEVISEAQSIISVTWNPAYYLVVALLFLVTTLPLMKLAGLMERRMKARGFAHD